MEAPDHRATFEGQLTISVRAARQLGKGSEIQLIAVEVQQFAKHGAEPPLTAGLGGQLGDDLVGVHRDQRPAKQCSQRRGGAGVAHFCDYVSVGLRSGRPDGQEHLHGCRVVIATNHNDRPRALDIAQRQVLRQPWLATSTHHAGGAGVTHFRP